MVNSIWEMVENVGLWVGAGAHTLLGLAWLANVINPLFAFKLGITLQAAIGIISLIALWRRR